MSESRSPFTKQQLLPQEEMLEVLKQKDLDLALNAVENNWKSSFSRFNI